MTIKPLKTLASTPLSKKTVTLLRKLQAYILEEPKRFNLELWGQVADPKKYKELKNEESSEYAYEAVVTQRPPCGAVGCIAGNICILSGDVVPKQIIKDIDGELEVYEFPENTPSLAQRALGITDEQRQRLFFLSSWGSTEYDEEAGDHFGWPSEFEDRLSDYSPGSKEYAQVTVDRIEYFILTGK